MEYKIRVEYSTGDSFRTYKTHEDVDYDWKNEDIVKENAKAIIAHYKAYESVHNSWSNKKPDIENIKKQWWYNEPSFKGDTIDAGMLLKLDDGTTVKYCCDWCGFFETLHSVEVKVKDFILYPD